MSNAAGDRVSNAAGDHPLAALAGALVALACRARDATRAALIANASGGGPLGAVVANRGGDDIFAIDTVADEVIVAGLAEIGARWPGSWVMEGFDEPLVVGEAAQARGPNAWRYLCDPIDGTRPLLAGKRSAWVEIGAGRGATTLESLELSVMVEVPTGRAAVGTVAWASADGHLAVWDEDLASGARVPVVLRPRPGGDVDHAFVTVVRFAPGFSGAIGAWQDRHLAGLVTFDDLVPCSAGQLMGLAGGADAAVFDPRPLLAPATMAAHPYDLAGFLVARAAGAIIEALPPGPLDVPLDTASPVAWAGYANEAIASRLRPRGPIV